MTALDPKVAIAISTARSFMDCKWRHRGRNKFGIDCIGIIVNAYQAAGIPIEDRLDYGRTPWKDGLENELERQFGPPVKDESLFDFGDIAIFDLTGRGASHVGILTPSRTAPFACVHSLLQHSVSENDLTGKWERWLSGVYKCPVYTGLTI